MNSPFVNASIIYRYNGNSSLINYQLLIYPSFSNLFTAITVIFLSFLYMKLNLSSFLSIFTAIAVFFICEMQLK
jgi:hypothetical protein